MAPETRKFTDVDKLKCLARELEIRRRVYPGRCEKGFMRQVTADYEIAVMQSIFEDYRAKIQNQRKEREQAQG